MLEGSIQVFGAKRSSKASKEEAERLVQDAGSDCDGPAD